MPRITLAVPLARDRAVPERKPLTAFLKFEDTGASSYGSTYRKSLIQCPHEHGLLYEVGLRPESPTEALTVGLIFHFALQRYYEAIMKYQREFEARWVRDHPENPRGWYTQDGYYWGGQSEASVFAWDHIVPLELEEGYKDTWDVVQRCVSTYFDRCSMMDRWRIIAVEETIEYLGEAAGTFNHTARLDLLVEDTKVGKAFLIEHKTAKFINENLIDFYDLDLQILGQCWLADKCLDWSKLPPFGGVIINIVSKHKTPISMRHAVLPSPRHMVAFENTISQLENVRAYQKNIGWSKSLGQCAGAPRGYSKCQFYAICREYPLETVATIATWRDAPSGFAFKGREAPTFENHEV